MRRSLASLAVPVVASVLWAGPLSAKGKRLGRLANLDALYEKLGTSIVTIEVLTSDREKGCGVSQGIGSGVILHRDGFIATAAHVVERAQAIVVSFKDESMQPAEIVTLSRTEDLALLKVAELPADVYVAPLGDSEDLWVGQPCFCIGAPLGLKHTLTTGIISAIRKDFGHGMSLYPRNVIQTDAALNQGNSGGALFNGKGEVIGIASFLASPTGGSIGLGFAVPSNVVRRRLFDDAIPYIGISLRRVPRPLAEALNWPVHDALLVEAVKPGSVAHLSGLRGGSIPADVGGVKLMMGGDLIVNVAQFHPGQAGEIHAYLHGLREGDHIDYTIVRGGQITELSVPVTQIIRIPKLDPNDVSKKKRKS